MIRIILLLFGFILSLASVAGIMLAMVGLRDPGNRIEFLYLVCFCVIGAAGIGLVEALDTLKSIKLEITKIKDGVEKMNENIEKAK